ncbi:MAG: plasmid pRiA4b ORF-3 family protein, partial [Planctomycetota bacterium]|nr:plasmid pRiA4b ORF-3 family protein [Planctomycetota bacterium]
PKWTLPSKMDDKPKVWMVSVNGFIMDIRHAPRELQVKAFENGLIPYIPADRGNDSEEEG